MMKPDQHSKSPKADELRKMRERDAQPDTSDISEAGEEWFKRARLSRGMPAAMTPRPKKKPRQHK